MFKTAVEQFIQRTDESMTMWIQMVEKVYRVRDNMNKGEEEQTKLDILLREKAIREELEEQIQTEGKLMIKW